MSNSKNKDMVTQCTFQKVWKILLIKKYENKLKQFLQMTFARNYEKKIIIGTSDAWSMSRLSQQPSNPATQQIMYIEDCRIFEPQSKPYQQTVL